MLKDNLPDIKVTDNTDITLCCVFKVTTKSFQFLLILAAHLDRRGCSGARVLSVTCATARYS